jgi:hypothetical protein
MASHRHSKGALEALARAVPGSVLELQMRRTLAAALLIGGQYSRAAQLFEQAGAAYRQHLGPTDWWALDCAYQAGHAYAQAVVVQQDPRTGTELAEHRPLAQARPLGQTIHGQLVRTLPGEHFTCHGQQMLPVSHGVGAIGTRRCHRQHGPAHRPRSLPPEQ